jgi:type II secretory pathway pseudopilin PulG
MTARHERQTGFSYIEAMVAVVLLAICAVPAAEAIRNGLDASRIASARAQELRCIKNHMETVLAEPYQNLWNAALGTKIVPAYSRADDNDCVERNVYISKYEHEYDIAPQFIAHPEESGKEDEREAVLLYITVSSGKSPYTFTTLVAR